MEAKLREEAVLIRDGKIVFVGGLSEAENMAGEDVEKVDLEGKTLLPSFIDAHSHFLGYANALLQVDLSEACSLEEIKKKIQNFIIEHKIEKGEWVLANGMDPDNLEEKMLPDITFWMKQHRIILLSASINQGIQEFLIQKHWKS